MTIKKRLFWSNILMIAVPVMAALAAGVCCIALPWLMLQNGGGLPLEDSGDFSWASREELYEKIWGLEAMGDNATVAVHINRLREKIEPDPAKPRYIQTV